MKEIAEKLETIVNQFYNKYKNLDDRLCSQSPEPDAWSLKEIIGHLIDSASNNHQRFVRLQRTSLMEFPTYHFSWIETENFNAMSFEDLLLLWRQFNRLLTHIIAGVPEESLHSLWAVEDEVLSLEFLITDYLRHLNEHLEHFKIRLAEVSP